MGKPAITTVDLGKCYRIRHSSPETTDSATESPGSRPRWLQRIGHSPKRDIWALRNCTFSVDRGEIVGVIGPNGAGKSTLLKILSRITRPTTGSAQLVGRVGSLIEVGTSFHPELTGRENVYFNGAVLGMPRSDIANRFESIVEFAETGSYLDTPVKYYSTGMQVRLAFSVAAHLDADILVIDEVLAVGDASFQRKCTDRILEAATDGRTILFVSHNLQTIRHLCTRALILRDGQLAFDGNVGDALSVYLDDIVLPEADTSRIDLGDLPKDPTFELLDIEVLQHGTPVTSVQNSDPLQIRLVYRIHEPVIGLRIVIDLYDPDGVLLFRSFHDEAADQIPIASPSTYISIATLAGDTLAPLRYKLVVNAGIHNDRSCLPPDRVQIPLHVESTSTLSRAYIGDPIRGRMNSLAKWTTTPTAER